MTEDQYRELKNLLHSWEKQRSAVFALTQECDELHRIVPGKRDHKRVSRILQAETLYFDELEEELEILCAKIGEKP